MAEPTPREIARQLILELGEQENNNALLHRQADELAAAGQLQPALRLLWSSIEIAKPQNDDYVLGAGRFHMALAYFVGAGAEEWDRAADLCERAAQHFEQKKCRREQGIAQLARGYIYEALCHAEHDRWTQGFHAYMAAYVLLRDGPEEYAEEARQAYARLGKKYADLGIAAEEKANAQAVADAGGGKPSTAPQANTTENHPPASDADPNNQDAQAQSARGNANGQADKTGQADVKSTPEGIHVSEMPPQNGGVDGNANAQSPPPAGGSKKSSTDPPKDPAPEPKKPPRFPPGLLSVRAVLERGFSFWAWLAFAGACVLCGLLLGVLTLAVSLLLEREPLLMGYLAFGLLLGAVLFLLPFVVLAGARQLWLQLPENQAAVVIERQRVWPLTRHGVHVLIPFHQDLVAFIPLGVRPYANFKRNVVQWDTRWLSAHIEATYCVCAPELFWDRVLYDLQRQKTLWVPSPLKLETVEGALDKHAETLIERSLILVAMDPEIRGLAANERALNDKIQELIGREAPADGIEFQNIEFSIMLSMSEQAP